MDVLVHRYLYVRLVRDVDWSPRFKRWARVVIIGLAILLPAGIMLGRDLPRSAGGPLAFASYIWMGSILYFFMAVVVLDIVRAVARRKKKSASNAAPEDPARRRVMTQVAAGTAAAVSGVALRGGLAEIEVREVQVKLPRLPKQLEGLTLVQLTDVHVGPTIGREFIESIVEKCNALKPDAMIITGDLVDGSVPQLRNHTEPLGSLKSRYGSYFVTGNHEYYSGAPQWEQELRRLGINVLRNERVSIGDAASIDLAGIDDYRAQGMVPGHGSDISRIVKDRDPERELVLLAHQPRSIELAAEAKAGLQISGHTHGGQLFPWSAFVRLTTPYVAGLYRHNDDTQIYVSRGTGYWGPPIRFGAPHEITKIRLRSA